MPNNPKPPNHRRRRNADQHEWRYLPAGASGVEPPPMPAKNRRGAWTIEAKSAWLEWWASPMARVWIEADKVSLRRALRLVDDIAAGRCADHSGLTALEDRLGLTPKARRMLQWEIQSAHAVPASPSRPASAGGDPRLRAV